MAVSPYQLLELLKRYLPRNPWKVIAFAFAILNFKNLPFVWHLRLVYHLIFSIGASKKRLLLRRGPSTLFLPVITSSRSTPYDCDYNLHKSNSAYFHDFDIGRLDLIVALLGHGIKITREQLAIEDKALTVKGEKPIGGGKGEWAWRTALGGVACQYKREIKPMQGFEVWTRLLTWDRKWVYLVGHFVKPGSVRTPEFVLQPGRKRTRWGRRLGGAVAPGEAAGVGPVEGDAKTNGEDGKEKHKEKEPVIFASAIAKYCFKYGRLTISPERVMRAAHVLPERPLNDAETPPSTSTPEVIGSTTGDAVDAVPAATKAAEVLRVDSALQSSLDAEGINVEDDWSWDRIEKERLKGMRIAESYGQLDRLTDAFNGGDGVALGQY